MKRTVNVPFITRLAAFRGEKKAQGTNSKQEVLAIAEKFRDTIEEGDTCICMVKTYNAAGIDPETGDVKLDPATGNVVYDGAPFDRIDVVAHGTAKDMAEAFYADEILDAEAQDIVAEAIVEARTARTRKPAVAGAEPVIA